MEIRTIKSTQLPKIKYPLFWEGTRKFNSMTRISYVIDSIGEGKTPIKSRLTTDSYLVPLDINDYIIKIFFDEIGTGITIFRVIDISNIAFPKVEVVKRKPSDSNEWILNSDSDIELSASNRIDNIISKTIEIIESQGKK